MNFAEEVGRFVGCWQRRINPATKKRSQSAPASAVRFLPRLPHDRPLPVSRQPSRLTARFFSLPPLGQRVTINFMLPHLHCPHSPAGFWSSLQPLQQGERPALRKIRC